jgi:hypothetical protein
MFPDPKLGMHEFEKFDRKLSNSLHSYVVPPISPEYG